MERWLFLICLIIVVHFFNSGKTENENKSRKAKFWPIGIVRFQNSLCTTLEGYEGTCYTKYQCRSIDGKPSGECANGIGNCCLVQRTCGESSSNNNTYFTNPMFPNTYSGSTQCIFTIQKCNSDICQARIDFLSLTLAQPDGNGNCVTDSLRVLGGASNVPIICGENSGQHMYVNFNGADDIRIAIATSASGALQRSWNIKVSQIGCDCPTLAPSGCLMYYTDLSHTVSSFNYGPTLSGALVTTPNGARPGTREMVNLNYGVCVQMQPGYCTIEWSQTAEPTSFTVSNNTALVQVTPGLPGEGLKGENCTMDYVVIPNPTYTNGTAVNDDRFCGNQFTTIRTASKPFVMTVVNNNNDMEDVANRGFLLQYTQIPCGTNSNLMIF